MGHFRFKYSMLFPNSASPKHWRLNAQWGISVLNTTTGCDGMVDCNKVLMPDGAFPFYIHGEKEKSHEILWICLNARWGISSLNTAISRIEA